MKNGLRTYIRLLVEAAVSGKAAAENGQALYRRQAGKFVHYILYSPKALLEVTQDPDFFSMRFKKPLGEIVLAYIQAYPRQGECNNATQITVSVATKGYGPLLYDIVMSDSEGGIMPDRNSTSDPAKNVWQHYAKRGDVDMHPFDDVDDPKTPEKDDDCLMVGDELLDQSFDGAGQGGAKASLLQNHEKAMEQIATEKLSRKSLEGVLWQIADGYFNQRYGK